MNTVDKKRISENGQLIVLSVAIPAHEVTTPVMVSVRPDVLHSNVNEEVLLDTCYYDKILMEVNEHTEGELPLFMENFIQPKEDEELVVKDLPGLSMIDDQMCYEQGYGEELTESFVFLDGEEEF